jgi:diguanylate cyclase (GGDEF)-like protein
MSRSWCNRVRQLMQHVQTWQVLQLPRWLVAFVAVVITADAAAITIAIRVSTVRPTQLLLFGGLVACGCVTVELTRRAGETALFIKDVCGVWELPIAILLPPAFAMLAPIPRIALTQMRIRKIALHRRVFTAAAISLSYGSVYLAFHEFSRIAAVSLGPGGRAALWILAVAACGVLQWVVNNLLIFPAIKGSDRGASLREMLLARENILNDLTEVCVGTVLTLGIAISPITIVFALPFVTLLQRSSRHAQLVDASRIDEKTGLLNATTWRRESSAELARSLRTGSGLAVALIDIDHFKVVNDTYGHLAGDEVLRAISRLLQLLVREYDLVGRFGGEEFALLLPQTDEMGARNIAERIRAQIADLRVTATSSSGTEPIALTVSIGVAMLDGTGADLTELLAAADAALYRAKDAGRDQVWVTTDTASASADKRELTR